MALPWTLEEALQITRKIAPIVHRCGVEVTLRVSPLAIQQNSDDLDVHLFVEKPGICGLECCLKEMKDNLPEIRAVGALQPVTSQRNATVWLRDGRHLEAHFVVC